MTRLNALATLVAESRVMTLLRDCRGVESGSLVSLTMPSAHGGAQSLRVCAAPVSGGGRGGSVAVAAVAALYGERYGRWMISQFLNAEKPSLALSLAHAANGVTL